MNGTILSCLSQVENNTDYNGTNIKASIVKKITTNRQFVSSLYLG